MIPFVGLKESLVGIICVLEFVRLAFLGYVFRTICVLAYFWLWHCCVRRMCWSLFGFELALLAYLPNLGLGVGEECSK